MEDKYEYLWKCPVCGKEFWGSLYYTPTCIHNNEIGFRMRGVYEPTNHEEPGAPKIKRLKKE